MLSQFDTKVQCFSNLVKHNDLFQSKLYFPFFSIGSNFFYVQYTVHVVESVHRMLGLYTAQYLGSFTVLKKSQL